MPKILNLIIEDRSDPKNTTTIVESFLVKNDSVTDPEKALRESVREFITSGSEEAKNALLYSCGYYNWADALSSVPRSLFEKHGLIMLNQDAVDVFVNHNEILCEPESNITENNNIEENTVVCKKSF